jgi:hypothetical protein
MNEPLLSCGNTSACDAKRALGMIEFAQLVVP